MQQWLFGTLLEVLRRLIEGGAHAGGDYLEGYKLYH